MSAASKALLPKRAQGATPFCQRPGEMLLAAAMVLAPLAGLAAPQAEASRKPSVAAHAKASQGKPAAAQAALPRDNAEARLLAIIAQVQRQELDGALKAAAALTAELPHFRAAQLVYADLLRFKAGSFRPAATAQSAPAKLLVKHSLSGEAGAAGMPAEWQASLQDLQGELKRRVHAASSLPAAGSIPGEFLTLGTSVRHAIAIDASKSRLYLFSNDGGRLRLAGDFYISVGKLGMGKTEEGDQKTPQGLYFIGRQIPGAKLPEFYGKGALTVNYPNDWDRTAGRSGSGIWLHGAPPGQFARLPEASDGCVVLANPDLLLLMQTVDLQTPVLIRDRLQWVAASDPAQKKAAQSFLQVLENWKSAWRSSDRSRLADIYTAELVQSDAGQPLQERLPGYLNGSGAGLKEVSVYAWKDSQGEIRIVNLKAGGKASSGDLLLRQYWRKTGNRWKLFSEDTMG